jgi:hypothetical protein
MNNPEPKIKWVDIVSFNAEKDAAKVVARCILEAGEIRFEGEDFIIDNIKTGVPSVSDAKLITPQDGEKFLKALSDQYRSAYLFATDVQSGDAVKDFKIPPMKKVE